MRSLPKAELHLHIEGTLEPELLFSLARRNEVLLPFASIDAVRAAYRFTDLQSFLDIYYQGMAVLQTRDDFAELMAAYLERAVADGVVHAEIFFDPQGHLHRGVGFATFMAGFRDAMADARRVHGITSDLILCFLRHLPADDAVATISEAEAHLEGVVAVGLDSSEVGHPPEQFEEAYRRARALGLRAVAHAGEEGPPSYIAGALDVLGVERIDHGVRCLEDSDLVGRLRRDRVPLTVCPLSNVALQVVDRLEDHPLPRMVDEGLMVTINSDDPAYFGGYVGDNYCGVADAFGWDTDIMARFAADSIRASFLDDDAKTRLLERLAPIDRAP
ncbi:MAG TPA: adenosine deaminase [Acidimicrobiia bacterium]|nr:adenosine deaminase [Acidimicrobiia bacterium]